MYKSRFRRLDFLLLLLLLRPVRCGECHVRRYWPIFLTALDRRYVGRRMSQHLPV